METPEEIKKGLECCKPLWKGDHWKTCDQKCPYTCEGSFCKNILNSDAIAYIQQLEAQNDAYDTLLSELNQYIDELKAQVPKWISVEEQEEPEEDGEYFCYGYWFGSGRKQLETAEYIGEWKIVNNFVLTHWMPMPEPPKED